MLKLGLVALIVLLILGVIVFSIFSAKPQVKTSIPFLSSPKPSTSTIFKDIKVADIKIKQPPQPIQADLFAPKQKTVSGYVRFSEVAGKILIQLKSDSTQDTGAFIYSGSCTGKGPIVYPLVSLQDSKSQTVWDINMDELKKQLPLAVKVFNSKNPVNFTRCADIKAS